MSVINQMLKDLALRSKPTTKPEIILSGLMSSKYLSKNHYSTYWLIGSVFIFFSTFITILFFPSFFSNHKKNATIFEEATTPLALQFKRLQFSSGSLTTAALTGITIQTEKEMTNLRFLLSGKTLYQLNTEDPNHLVIVLEHTQLDTSLPPLNTINSAIKSMEMTNLIDGNLKISLVLEPEAELKTLGLNQQSKFPELQINFSYKSKIDPKTLATLEPVLAETTSSGTVKKTDYIISINEEYQHAVQMIDQQNYSEAISLLTEIVNKDPSYATARRELAALLLAQGNLVRAEQIILTGLEQRPLYTPFIQLKAQLLVESGKIDQALNLLQESPPSLGDNPEYHAMMAALYQRQGKAGLAESLYEQLINVQPDNSVWWMGLGIARENMNKKNEALDAYFNAMKTANLNPESKAYVGNRIYSLQ